MLSICQGFKLIFGKINSLAACIGSLPPDADTNLACLADIGEADRLEVVDGFIDESLHVTANVDDDVDIDPAPFDARVGVRGFPESVPPLLKFVLVNCAWRLGRKKPVNIKRPDLKAVRPISLRCVVCRCVDMATLTDPSCNRRMVAWASIQLPCCEKCYPTTVCATDPFVDKCFCCSAPAIVSIQRADNGVCFLLCNICNESEWLGAIKSAGIELVQNAYPCTHLTNVSAAILSQAAPQFSKHLIDIHESQSAAKKVAIEVPPPSIVAETPLYDQISSSIECAQCKCENATLFCCAEPSCGTHICATCAASEYGDLWCVFVFSKQWKCEVHK